MRELDILKDIGKYLSVSNDNYKGEVFKIKEKNLNIKLSQRPRNHMK